MKSWVCSPSGAGSSSPLLTSLCTSLLLTHTQLLPGHLDDLLCASAGSLPLILSSQSSALSSGLFSSQPALQTPCGCSAAAPGTDLCSLWNSAAGKGWTEDPEQEKNPGMCSGHLDPLLRKDPGQEAAAERTLSTGKGPAQI